MEPRTDPVFAAIVVADQADARGRALALADQDGAPAAARAMFPLEAIANGPKLLVLGPDADDVEAEMNTPGWEILRNDHWQQGPVYGACMAMERLPLVDAFFLSVVEGNAPAAKPDMLERMAETYVSSRRKLGRIVVPLKEGKRLWPWLIDIGFRQPFVQLAKGAHLDAVLVTNASQVVTIALP